MAGAIEIGVLGLAVGVLSGMLGIGGGIVMVPGMVLLLAIPQHLAQGTSLAVVAATSLVGAATHYRQGNVWLRLVVTIAPPAVLFGFLGAQLASALDDRTLRIFFSIVLFVMGFRMLSGDAWSITGFGREVAHLGRRLLGGR